MGLERGRRPRHTLRLNLLRVVGAVAKPFLPAAPLPTSPAKVLVLRPDHLGDALFTTPALRGLRELYPSAEISALVGPWARPVYGRLDSLDRLIECPCPGFTPHPKRHALEPYQLLFAEARRLRQGGFALSVNLRFDFWWGAMLAAYAGIPSRLGYAVPECRPFLTHAITHVRGRHEVVQNLALVAELAGSGESGREWLMGRSRNGGLEFPLREGELAAAQRLLDDAGRKARPLVAIQPGTRGRAKLWTTAGWAAVADGLASRFGMDVLLTGSEAEAGLCADIRQRMQTSATVMAGGTSLGELIALFARCRLVLGVDSGPLHMAVAVGVPTVHLYGPSDHLAFGPFGDPHRHVVVRSGVACSPCHRFDWPEDSLGEHDCMRAILPETVLAAAEQAIFAG